MSYSTISQSSTDQALIARLVAATAQEGEHDAPESFVQRYLKWPVVTQSDIAAAYESAVLAEHPNPGGDASVITDQMILSSVQANWPDETPRE
jgi:hypothetical protein